MATWEEMRSGAPNMTAAGERILHANGEGLAFLGTVRRDGGPRMHLVLPVLASGRLYVFVATMSPKYQDLLRDRRFALHSLPRSDSGEEFYLTGHAVAVEDEERRQDVIEASGTRVGNHEFEALFELDLRRGLYTRWTDWGTPQAWPEYERWRSGQSD
jgi:hypothetical protein